MFSPIFLSTPSARRATITCCSRSSRECISIHALCEEGDLPGRAYGLIYNISIHALCEEGDAVQFVHLEDLQLFLSTPSARRATIEDAAGDVPGGISIHALCEEGDV